MGYRRLYNIRIYDQSTGALNGWWNNGLSLRYTKKLNDVGICIWAVEPDHPVLVSIAEDDRIEISVTNDNSDGDFLSWTKDFVGIYREKQTVTDQTGNQYVLLYFPSAEEILTRAIVAYYAGTNLRTEYTAQQIAQIFSNTWRYNLTSDGTTGDGRIRNAGTVLSTTGSGSASATVIDYKSAWKNVLSALQELAELGSNTFYLTRNTSTNELTILVDSNNTDVSSNVIFSLATTTIGNAALEENKISDKTVAIVGGSGQESSRTVVARTGTNQSATNDYEIFVDYKDTSNTDILSDRGDAIMAQLEAHNDISISAIQSQGYTYLNDYALGNLVSLNFAGATVTKQISQVTVSFEPFMKVELGMRDPL